MPRQKIDTKRAVQMYTNQHATMEEIARVFGVRRSAVHKALHNENVIARDGTHVKMHCGHCGAPMTLTRARWRQSTEHYCGQTCYGAARRAQ